MRKIVRIVAVVGLSMAPFVVGGATQTAQASCQPGQKPTACEPECPGEWRRIGSFNVCVPLEP